MKKFMLAVVLVTVTVTSARGYYDCYYHWPDEYTGNSHDCDYCVYVDYKTGECLIQYLSLSSSSTRIDIPASYGSFTITGIANDSFKDFQQLRIVTIPNTISGIGPEAFARCSSLTSVLIPNSVERIDDWVFEGCSSLTSIVIPNSVKEIGFGVFSGCENLTQVTMPYRLYSRDGVLKNCGLEEVVIPEGVVNLGNFMFSDCSKLRNVVLPDSLISIGTGAFEGCDNLSQIIIPENVNQIGAYSFAGTSKLKTIVFKGLPPTIVDWDGDSSDELLCEEPWFPDDDNVIWAVYPPEYEVEWLEAWDAATMSTGGWTWHGLVPKRQERYVDLIIHFNANGGVGDMDDMSVKRDLVLPTLFPELADSIDLPYPTGFIAPPSNSHKFIGWGLSADVDGVNNPELLVKTTNDLWNHFLQNDLPSSGIISLFAIWGKSFTVQFDANGGTGTMSPQTFFDGKRQKLSKNAYAKGSNVFIGWAVSSNDAEKGLVKYFDEDEFPDDDSDNSDKTLYAVWTTSVTVSFYNQEDKTLKPTSLGDYMRWKVEGESIGVWHRPGEFKELEPGKYYKFLFDVTEMEWMVWPKTSEKVVYVIGASAFNSTTLLAGESFQYVVSAH